MISSLTTMNNDNKDNKDNKEVFHRENPPKLMLIRVLIRIMEKKIIAFSVVVIRNATLRILYYWVIGSEVWSAYLLTVRPSLEMRVGIWHLGTF